MDRLRYVEPATWVILAVAVALSAGSFVLPETSLLRQISLVLALVLLAVGGFRLARDMRGE